MTKPIEWTTTENMPVIFWHRMHVDESGELRDATPADLAAALAAMGEGEREEVLRASGAAASFDMQTAIITDLRTRLKEATRLHSEAESSLDVERALRGGDARYADAKLNESIARAEKAERERDEARNRNAQRDRDWDVIRTLTDAGAGFTVAAVRRVVSERDSLLESVAAREKERDEARERADQKAAAHSDLAVAHRKALLDLDEARKERDRSNHLRAGMLPDTRLELGALGCEDVAVAARRVVAERNRAQEERDKARAEQERLLQSNARYSAAADEAIRDRDLALGERNRAQAERDAERACRLENEAELHRANKELGDLRTRLIAALKAERDDARLRCGAALATAATATARADTAAASHLASAGLVAEFRGRLAAAESALDVAQSRAVRAEKLADEALADRDRARASLDIVRHDLEGTRRDLDDLRTRAIAAETTAAQREPREYPLAEGSRWEGDDIVDALGQRISDSGMGALHLDWNAIRRAALWKNVFALAHRRGLL
jgi:hypothetical protein